MKAIKNKNGYTMKIGRIFKTKDERGYDQVVSKFIGYNAEEHQFLRTLIPKLLEYCRPLPMIKGEILEFSYNHYSGYEKPLEEDTWLDFLLSEREWSKNHHDFYHKLGSDRYRKRHLIYDPKHIGFLDPTASDQEQLRLYQEWQKA